MNLFESFDEIVTNEFIEKFKSYTSTTHGDLNVTVKGVFYTLLAGMIRKTNSDMSASMLFGQIEENAKKVSLPDNLASIFSQEALLAKIGKDGSKIISQIFPAYKSPLLSMISTYSGVSKATTTMASDIVANVIITIFKRDIDSGKWDKDQLVSNLRQHHEPLMEAIPEALLEKMIPALGMHNLRTAKPIVSKKDKPENTAKMREEPEPITAVESTASSNVWWIVIVLAIAVLAGGGYYYYSQNGNLSLFTKKEVPVESIEDLAVDSMQVAAPPVQDNVPEDYRLFKAYINGAEPAGKEFDLPSLRFVSDSTALTPAAIALADSVGAWMTSNPKLQLKVLAFSPSGDNAFNNKRAFFVKRLWTNQGINGIRIDAVSGGIGEDVTRIKVISK